MRIDRKKFTEARAGRTLAQLSEKSGVNISTISNINCGKSTKYETIKRLADALGVDVMSLVKED